jgi:hypothetical protein
LQTGPWKLAPGTLERIGGLQFGPWLDLGIEEAAAAVFPATAVAGAEGLGVGEHKEVERDLGRHSGRAGVVGGGPATKLCSRRRWRVAAVALRQS